VQTRRRLTGPAAALMVLGCAVILGSIAGGIALSVVGSDKVAPGAGLLPASVNNAGDITSPPAVGGGATQGTAPPPAGSPASSEPVHVVASAVPSRTASPRPSVPTSPTPRPSGSCRPIGPTPIPTGPTSPPCDD
jgi:5'-nucleotidase